MRKFHDLEIIECENGFIILEGNSFSQAPMSHLRKKWIANSPKGLSEVVMYIVCDATQSEKLESNPESK